jgi:RsmE family RNA methyltransferase
MNLILFDENDEIEAGNVRIGGRRAKHIAQVHRAVVGDVLRVGRIGGKLGNGTILAVAEHAVTMAVEELEEPPAPVGIVLAVALSRPPTVQKVLAAAASLGVKDLLFFHSRRVEKSYWQSHALTPEAIREHLLLGLEQARDTVLPTVHFCPKFMPFAQDRLPEMQRQVGPVFFAHPGAQQSIYDPPPGPCVLVLGPEGGFVAHEIEVLEAQGFCGVGLGPRILRVEVAVTACLSVRGALR